LPGHQHREALDRLLPPDRRGGRDGQRRCLEGLLGRRVESRVLHQDRAFERHERRARLDPEVVVEHVAYSLERVQCVGLPSGAVEPEHQLAPQALPVRRVRDGLLQPDDGGCLVAACELGVDLGLESLQAQLLESRDRRLGPRVAVEVAQRGGGPERQCLVVRAVGHRPLELGDVDLAGPVERVSDVGRPDHVVPQCLPQAAHVDLDGVLGARGRVLAPDPVDQRLDGYDVPVRHG
jgi:hypothetical protein